MELKIYLPDDTDIENCEFTGYMKIVINGKEALSIIEGSDFSDCKKIPDILKKVYEAGFNKEELFIIRK